MNQAGKIDTMYLDTSSTIILDDTDNERTPVPEESVIRGYASSPRVDTGITPKVNDEININKTNNNILQEIPNMTPYLAQPENNVSSLIESNSQMTHSAESLIPPIGGIGAIPVMMYMGIGKEK
nr:6799_t:CDS:2 [Entrophospora candida]